MLLQSPVKQLPGLRSSTAKSTLAHAGRVPSTKVWERPVCKVQEPQNYECRGLEEASLRQDMDHTLQLSVKSGAARTEHARRTTQHWTPGRTSGCVVVEAVLAFVINSSSCGCEGACPTACTVHLCHVLLGSA